MIPSPIATSTTAALHRVRLIHGGTGATINAVALAPRTWPYGLAGRVVDGRVIVTRRAGTGGTVAHVDIVITDATLRARLALPEVAGNPSPDRVRVDLDAEVIDHPVTPRSIELVAHVTEVDTGAPATGRTVTLRRVGGAVVPLVEGAAGEYTAELPTWDPSYMNAELRVGTTTIRRVSPDTRRFQTRIDAVDRT